MCFSVTGEPRQYLLALLLPTETFCTAAQGGGILLASCRLTPPDGSLQRKKSIFFPVNAFLLSDSYFCCLFFILSNFFWFVKYFFHFSLFFLLYDVFSAESRTRFAIFCTKCKNPKRMLDFIGTRCYTKTQIYFFVSVSRRSLPCVKNCIRLQNLLFC